MHTNVDTLSHPFTRTITNTQHRTRSHGHTLSNTLSHAIIHYRSTPATTTHSSPLSCSTPARHHTNSKAHLAGDVYIHLYLEHVCIVPAAAAQRPSCRPLHRRHCIGSISIAQHACKVGLDIARHAPVFLFTKKLWNGGKRRSEVDVVEHDYVDN